MISSSLSRNANHSCYLRGGCHCAPTHFCCGQFLSWVKGRRQVCKRGKGGTWVLLSAYMQIFSFKIQCTAILDLPPHCLHPWSVGLTRWKHSRSLYLKGEATARVHCPCMESTPSCCSQGLIKVDYSEWLHVLNLPNFKARCHTLKLYYLLAFSSASCPVTFHQSSKHHKDM